MHEAVSGVILMSGRSEGHPRSSISSCCLCFAVLVGQRLGGRWGSTVGWEMVHPPLQSPFISIRNIYGTGGIRDSREQGGFMASRQRLVQMCRAATISCQQNLWRYISQEKVVSN